MSPDLLSQPVSRIMSATPKTIRPGALAAEALGLMNDRRVTQLVVVDGDRPVGIVRMHDILRAGAA
jgi:arabinose-5-phosphate isomerase